MSRVITQQNLEIINDINEKLKPDFELLEKYEMVYDSKKNYYYYYYEKWTARLSVGYRL